MTALATQPTGPPIIPQSSSRIASLERVSLRPESLLDCARRRRLALDAAYDRNGREAEAPGADRRRYSSRR